MNIIIDEISLFGQGLIDDAVEESLNVPIRIYPWICLGAWRFPDLKTATVR